MHIFERDEKGNLKPVKTEQKYPPKIIEDDGQEQNILPQGTQNLSALIARQKKLEKALELQKTIDEQKGKTHVIETLEGGAIGAFKGATVGIITTGNAELGGTIGAIKGANRAYRASKAETEEIINECEEQRDEILSELNIDIKEAQQEVEQTERYLGDHLSKYGY